MKFEPENKYKPVFYTIRSNDGWDAPAYLDDSEFETLVQKLNRKQFSKLFLGEFIKEDEDGEEET